MAKVSAKRQITIPIDLCKEAHIEPGDEVEVFIHDGQITIVKKESGAARGILEHIPYNRAVSDEESLHSTLKKRQKATA